MKPWIRKCSFGHAGMVQKGDILIMKRADAESNSQVKLAVTGFEPESAWGRFRSQTQIVIEEASIIPARAVIVTSPVASPDAPEEAKDEELV